MLPFKRNFITASAIVVAIALFACSGNNKKGSAEPTVFRKIGAKESGITFSNNVTEDFKRNNFDTFAYVYNGAGVAIGDINSDGLQDIYFTGNEVPNKLYLNL